jgi:hypothetical protein
MLKGMTKVKAYDGLAIGEVPSPGLVLNAIPSPVIKSDRIDQTKFLNFNFVFMA